MSVTYDHGFDRDDAAPAMEENYIPVYARRGKSARKSSHSRVAPAREAPVGAPGVRSAKSSKGGVKTWMILAPVGALVVGGAAAWMLTSTGEDTAAPVESAAAPAALTPAPLAAAPLATPTAPAPVEVAPQPVSAAPTPVSSTRTAAPVRREAPLVRRAAPTAPQAPVAATTASPSTPTGPQPYSASATSSLNTTTPAATTPAPRALQVETQPLN